MDWLADLYVRLAPRLILMVQTAFPQLGRAGAEDVVQTAFLEALEVREKRPDFRPGKVWVKRRVRQRAIDRVRQLGRAPRLNPPSGNDADDVDDDRVEQVAVDPSPGPEAQAVEQSAIAQLFEAVPDPVDRACVVLKSGGYREREIASRLGMSYARRQVQKRLRRIERTLRRARHGERA